MSWAILADSSCNLREYRPKAVDAVYRVAPLKINIAGREYVDDASLDVAELNRLILEEDTSSSSSCPSVGEWAELFRSADNIIAIDLHQDAIQGFFDKPVNHMTAMPIFVDYFEQKGFKSEELCVVSPDVGRAKAAKKFSTLLDCDIAIMHKDRPKHNQAEITALIGDVKDKICILNDDMIDTAGSLVAAATTLKAKGAKKIYACATHGLFSGPAYERLENSCIEEVVVTNAVPVPLERQTGKIKVVTLAPLFAQTIKNVYNNGSVASLFE